MSVRLICALHGFLGQGSDWDPVKENLEDFSWVTPSLFAPVADVNLAFSEVVNSPFKKIFLGYSLGGRIGLSILRDRPETFDHYIFVSSNPGFADSDIVSREQRLKQDSDWGNKISLSNWENFIREWNSQFVFVGSLAEPLRDVQQYDLEKLKTFLMDWSLAKQQDYSELIKKNKERITWVTGGRDEKFVSISEKLKSNSCIDSYYKIESGHRIPFDSPKKLAEIVKTVADRV